MEQTKNLGTADGIAEALLSLSGSDLAQIPHSLLYNARYRVPKEQQNLISPYEHRAFAREATLENPMMALPIAASVIPYQIYKAVDGSSRSTPSIDQVLQGFMGVGEGLVGAVKNTMR